MIIVQNNGKKLEKLCKSLKKFLNKTLKEDQIWLSGYWEMVEINIEKILDLNRKLVDTNRIKLRNHR